MELTSHSLWPWKLSWLSLFTAITMPVPGLVAANESSSIQPLKTEPNPPSPRTLSGRKFLVATLRSEREKLFKLEDCKISPSLLGFGGTKGDETLPLELLESLPSVLAFLELNPEEIYESNISIKLQPFLLNEEISVVKAVQSRNGLSYMRNEKIYHPFLNLCIYWSMLETKQRQKLHKAIKEIRIDLNLVKLRKSKQRWTLFFSIKKSRTPIWKEKKKEKSSTIFYQLVSILATNWEKKVKTPKSKLLFFKQKEMKKWIPVWEGLSALTLALQQIPIEMDKALQVPFPQSKLQNSSSADHIHIYTYIHTS